jgi:hypothetical protein
MKRYCASYPVFEEGKCRNIWIIGRGNYKKEISHFGFLLAKKAMEIEAKVSTDKELMSLV